MELLLLDKDYRICGLINEWNRLVWSRRYFEVGEFSLELPAAYYPLLANAKYLHHSVNGETGVIENIRFRTSKQHDNSAADNGEELTVSGRMLEAILAMRVFNESEYLSGRVESVLYPIITKYLMSGDRKIPKLALEPMQELDAPIYAEPGGENMMTKLYAMLRTSDLSYRIRYHAEEDQLLFGIYSGLDRTSAQTEHERAIFSSSLGNLLDIDYREDQTLMRNFAYVMGQQYCYIIDLTNENEERREVYINAAKFSGSSIYYYSVLWQYGMEKLLNMQKHAKMITAVLPTDGWPVYRSGYDLGDICELEYHSGSAVISASLRITELNEVWENNNMTLTGVFN